MRDALCHLRPWRDSPALRGVHILPAILFLLCSVFPAFARPQSAGPSEGLKDALRRYKCTEVQNPEALARVQGIVARILHAADANAASVPEVALIEGIANAWALEGHYLFVTEKLVNLLPKDDQLAVVLGHEIAHIVRGDTIKGPRIEDEVSQAAVRGGFQGSLYDVKNTVTRTVESEADGSGLLFSWLAGYDVSGAAEVYDTVLLNNNDPTHPPKEERKRNFEARLGQFLDNISVFQAGVDFYLRGLYSYSGQVFGHLVDVKVRTKEVYLNLGAIHHLQAFQKHLKPEDSPVEICSLSMELSSSFEPQGARRDGADLSKSLGDDVSRKWFREELDKAVKNYEQAGQIDPRYALARNNLGCALIHRQAAGDDYKAVGELQGALQLEPGNAVIANNLGVALLGIKQQDAGLAEFRRAISLAPNFAPAHYNLAVTLDRNPAPEAQEEAAREFDAYLESMKDRAADLELPYLLRARSHLHQASSDASTVTRLLRTSAALLAKGPVGLPILPGDKVSSLADGTKADRTFDVVSEDKIELWRFADWQMLVMAQVNGRVDQVNLEGASYRTGENIGVGSREEEVRKAYGVPVREQSRGAIRLLCYENLGLLFRLRDGRVTSWSVFKPL